MEAADRLRFLLCKMENTVLYHFQELQGGKCWPLEIVSKVLATNYGCIILLCLLLGFLESLPGNAKTHMEQFCFAFRRGKKGNHLYLVMLCTNLKVASAQ